MIESLGRLLGVLVPIIAVYFFIGLLIGKPRGRPEVFLLHVFIWIIAAIFVCVFCYQQGLRG